MKVCMKDYYQILGVRADATKEEIMRSYRMIITADANACNASLSLESVQLLADVNLAYSVLRDAAERRLYDQSRTTDDSSRLALLSQKALTAYHTGDLNMAIEHYSEALSLDPGNSALLTNRAVTYYANNKFNESAQDAKAAINIYHQCFNAHYILITSLHKLGQSSDALAALTHACNLFPENDTLLKLQALLQPEQVTMPPRLSLPVFTVRPLPPPTQPRPPLDPVVDDPESRSKEWDPL